VPIDSSAPHDVMAARILAEAKPGLSSTLQRDGAVWALVLAAHLALVWLITHTPSDSYPHVVAERLTMPPFRHIAKCDGMSLVRDNY
jgi:hypothetical protein